VLDPQGRPLPHRLSEILSLASEGLTDKQIANHLGIQASTVESHWKRLRTLFGASARIEILARALRTREALEQLDKDKLVEKLLAEISERKQIEESLRNAVAERDKAAMDLIQMTTLRVNDRSAAEKMAWRETLERAIESTGCMVYHSQLGAPWQKYNITQNASIFGIDAMMFLTVSASELPFHPPDMAAIIPSLPQILASNALGLIWEYRIRVDEGLRWFRDYTSFRYSDGTPVDYTGVCFDVTDLKEKAGEDSPMTPVIVRQPSDWRFPPSS